MDWQQLTAIGSILSACFFAITAGLELWSRIASPWLQGWALRNQQMHDHLQQLGQDLRILRGDVKHYKIQVWEASNLNPAIRKGFLANAPPPVQGGPKKLNTDLEALAANVQEFYLWVCQNDWTVSRLIASKVSMDFAEQWNKLGIGYVEASLLLSNVPHLRQGAFDGYVDATLVIKEMLDLYGRGKAAQSDPNITLRGLLDSQSFHDIVNTLNRELAPAALPKFPSFKRARDLRTTILQQIDTVLAIISTPD